MVVEALAALALVTAVLVGAVPAVLVGAVPATDRVQPAAVATSSPAHPAALAAAAVRPRSTPVRLSIPSIGVDTAVVPLGLETDGSLEVPAEGFPAGWYSGSPTPGELGPAVLAGHVDWSGEPGVFYDLRALRPGDELSVEREDGSTALFRVTATEQFDKDRFPTELVYGDVDHAGLRLITCSGSFDRAARSYEDNLVVFAEAVPPSTT